MSVEGHQEIYQRIIELERKVKELEKQLDEVVLANDLLESRSR